jgi:hypothetical protein
MERTTGKTLKRWYLALQDLGCIVCLNEERGYSPPDIHHIHKNGNRRVDDFHTIPLCPLHHRDGNNTPEYVSRHPWKKEFEKRYGSEWDLFKQVQDLIEDSTDQQ